MSYELAQKVLNGLARVIDRSLNGGESGRGRPKKWGFALLIYPFGERLGRDRISYIGNGEPEDMLVALKELAARLEETEGTP